MASGILLDLGADADRVRAEVGRMLSGPAGRLSAQHLAARRPPSREPIDWYRAQVLWRPEGLELRVPIRLDDGGMAARRRRDLVGMPLAALRREIWSGWVALASPTLLDDIHPHALRRALDVGSRAIRE